MERPSWLGVPAFHLSRALMERPIKWLMQPPGSVAGGLCRGVKNLGSSDPSIKNSVQLCHNRKERDDEKIHVVNASNAYTSHMTVAYFICDWESDQVTNLTPPIPVPSLNTTFLSAVDLYVRGATPPDATISIVDIPHGDCGAMHTVNLPD